MTAQSTDLRTRRARRQRMLYRMECVNRVDGIGYQLFSINCRMMPVAIATRT